MGYLEQIKKVCLCYLVAEKMIIVARENIQSRCMENLAVNRAWIVYLPGSQDFSLQLFRVVAPVRLHPNAPNRALPGPFAEGYGAGRDFLHTHGL